MRGKTRRGWLVLGGVGLLASAACPAEAGTQTEIEGGVHGGTAAGSWACGLSNVKVKYGGGGARGRVWLNQPQPAPDMEAKRAPQGFSIGGGLSAEFRRYTLSGCNPSVVEGSLSTQFTGKPCTTESYPIPSDGLYGGALVFVGYDQPWVGGRGGVIAYQQAKDESSENGGLKSSKKLQLWPELNIRIGQLTKLHGEVGTGSYSFDNIMRPAVVYAGLIWPTTDRVELAFRLGQHEIFDSGQKEVRADVSAKFSVSDSFRLGLGGGAYDGLGGIHPHGRLTLGAAF